MLYPLTMFCCGCSVPIGVGIILVCHLAECIIFIACAISNIIVDSPTFASSWSTPSQLSYTGFCLIGIPIIAAALYGVVQRIEANLRIYLYYLTLCFVVNVAMVVYWCLVEDACDSVGNLIDAFKNFGESFMCGIFEIASYIIVTTVVVTEVYCLWVVWSFCEDVHMGKNGPELSGLIPGKDEAIKKMKRDDGPYAGIVGFANTKLPGPYPNPYGAIPTRGNGQNIFGGSTHETNYPPPPED